MGCSKTPSDENDDDIDDYDERYNFYNFKSKRITKNPAPPIKDYSNKKDNYSESSNNNKETENKNEEENEDEKNNKKNDDNKKSKSGDLYRNKSSNKNGKNNANSQDENNLDEKSKNKNKIPNGDIDDILNDNNDKRKKGKKYINNRYIDYEDEEDYSNIDNGTNKKLFSEKGNTIPNYENNEEKLKKLAEQKEEEEKKKIMKKSKINGITIVENLKDYFPEDITKEEIKKLVFEAFGDSIVEDMSLYIPGQTVTYEQANELSNYIYNIVKNKKNNNNKCLEDLNVKIDLVPLNRKLIKEKMFKGKEPSDKQIENIFQSYGGESSEIKVLTIEFQ